MSRKGDRHLFPLRRGVCSALSGVGKRCLSPFLLCLVGALALAYPGGAQPRAEPRERVRRHLPPPVLFAYDVTGPLAPAIARELGLTAVYVPLRGHTPEDLEAAQASLEAAHDEDMPAIVGLPCYVDQWRPSPVDEKYAQAATVVLRAVVRKLQAEPAVAAWATMDFPNRALEEKDRHFRTYLERWYKAPSVLNRAWGSDLSTFAAATMERAAQLDQDKPYRCGRASFDLCEYRRQALIDLHRLWAEAVRMEDEERPLLTGRLERYSSLLCIPDEYDVIVPAVSPQRVGGDEFTHNVHGVDIARRGNRFVALPALVSPPLQQAGEAPLLRWAAFAALHGAAGLAFEDVQTLASWKALSSQFTRLCRTARVNPAFGRAPSCSAAVLLEPYADGGEPGDPGPYGFIPDLPELEPAHLCEDLARGSRFGPVDFFTLEDLREIDLDRYGAVLAPCAAAMPSFAEEALAEYVGRGGFLAADLGLGAHDTGSWGTLPPRLAELGGVARIVEVRRWQGDLVFAEHPLLPSVRPGRVLADPRHPLFSGWTWLAEMAPGARAAAILTQEFEEEPTGPPGPDGKPTRRRRVAGVIAHQTGEGLCLLATHTLWGKWRRGQRGWEEFHHDLLARRARYGLLDQPGLLPSDLDISSDGEWLFVLNMSQAEQLARIHVPGAAHRACLGGFAHFSTQLRDASGRPGGDAIVSLPAQPLEIAAARLVPVEVRPREGEAVAEVTAYGEGMIQLTVAGQGASVQRRRGGYRLVRGRYSTVRLVITSGGYRVTPGSRHTLTIEESGRERKAFGVTADEQGRLVYEDRIRLAELTVKPAE